MSREYVEVELSETLVQIVEERARQENFPSADAFLTALIREDIIGSLPLEAQAEVIGLISVLLSKGGN